MNKKERTKMSSKIRIEWFKKENEEIKGHGSWFSIDKIESLESSVESANKLTPELYHYIAHGRLGRFNKIKKSKKIKSKTAKK